MLHVGLSREEPWQGLPPLAGDGFVQDLDLYFVPPPHVAVHEVQLPQLFHLPFTVEDFTLTYHFKQSLNLGCFNGCT